MYEALDMNQRLSVSKLTTESTFQRYAPSQCTNVAVAMITYTVLNDFTDWHEYIM